MTMVDSLKRLLGGVTSAIQNVKGAISGICEELDERAREESALLSAPLAPAAVMENLQALIADLGRRWTAAHGMDVVRGASGGLERGAGPAHDRPAGRVVAPHLEDVLPGVVTFDMMCALVPDVLIDGLRRVVQGTTYQPGPAMATRLERLAAIEEERATLQRRHAELVDEAAAAGVQLAHLPEEVGARLNKQRRRAAWEADVRMNRDYYSRNPSARPPEPE